MSDLTIEEVANELLKTKLEVHEIKTSHKDLRADFDLVEARISELKDELKKHEKQRIESTAEITKEVKVLKALVMSNSEKFTEHDEKEMEKYDLIIKAIDDLTLGIRKVKTETDDNSKALMQKRIAEEKQRAINEALEAHDAPFKEIKKKAILSAVGIVTGAFVIGTWKLIVFISTIDKVVGVN